MYDERCSEHFIYREEGSEFTSVIVRHSTSQYFSSSSRSSPEEDWYVEDFCSLVVLRFKGFGCTQTSSYYSGTFEV